MLATAEEVRIVDLHGNLVGLLPTLDEVGLRYVHRLSDTRKVVTVAANNVMREHWIDDAPVLADAQRLLTLRRRVGPK